MYRTVVIWTLLSFFQIWLFGAFCFEFFNNIFIDMPTLIPSHAKFPLSTANQYDMYNPNLQDIKIIDKIQ